MKKTNEKDKNEKVGPIKNWSMKPKATCTSNSNTKNNY